MPLEILSKLNWVDVVLFILALRIVFVALKTGFLVEIFKLLGTVAAVYFSMHYYTRVSDLIRGMIKIEEKMPLEFLDFLSFILLAAAGYLLFWGLRSSFNFFFKTETVHVLSKWGGLVIGVARGALLLSLLTFMLVISSVPYLKESVGKSYSGKKILRVAPDVYFYCWNNLCSKFATKEKSNETVLEVQRGIK